VPPDTREGQIQAPALKALNGNDTTGYSRYGVGHGFRIHGSEDNFMGVFQNIRHGVAVTICAAAMSTSVATAAQASTTHAARPAYPPTQYGEVHSCVTNLDASVKSTNGGETWSYTGAGGQVGQAYQYGVVLSRTTGLQANVVTHNGGYNWSYAANSGPPFCSAP
jgi:hypothetical protein